MISVCMHAAKWKPVGSILPRLVLVAELVKDYGCLPLWNGLRIYRFIWSPYGWWLMVCWVVGCYV